MSVLDNQTRINSVQSFFAPAGSSGGGSGSNIVASTITLAGSADPLEITLNTSVNDGFAVRTGGATNPIAIVTIDAANAGRAEFGVRSLSTIAGNPFSRGRFEMNIIPSTDLAQLSYTLDANNSGNPSTIGSIQFKKGTAPTTGTVVIAGEDGTALTVGNNSVISAPTGVHLDVFKAGVEAGGNIYVPAAGTTQNIASFSTIAGHAYELWLPNLRIQNQPAGAPAVGSWCQLTVDTASIAYCDTFDMASVSTIANDLQKTPAYNFTASGNSHTLQASGSLANTLSTALTISPASVYLRDLGAVANFQTVG
jgi:hypothetical protein